MNHILFMKQYMNCRSTVIGTFTLNPHLSHFHVLVRVFQKELCCLETNISHKNKVSAKINNHHIIVTILRITFVESHTIPKINKKTTDSEIVR